jgi:hypothetical protein
MPATYTGPIVPRGLADRRARADSAPGSASPSDDRAPGIEAALISKVKKTSRRGKKQRPGSPTNASDAVDQVELEADASADDVLDEGLQETFPASDPIAVGKAYKRKNKKKRA